MFQTITFHDLLAIFFAGVVVGMIVAAILTHKVNKYFNRKFSTQPQ